MEKLSMTKNQPATTTIGSSPEKTPASSTPRWEARLIDSTRRREARGAGPRRSLVAAAARARWRPASAACWPKGRGNWPGRPRVGELLLTPANARRVAEQLAQMRGAAMKVGQLLSMDGGDLLPPELSEILSRLRSDARPMPMSQLVPVLAQNWGEGPALPAFFLHAGGGCVDRTGSSRQTRRTGWP
jgi:hypothetical protein